MKKILFVILMLLTAIIDMAYSSTLINISTHEREQRQAVDIKSVEIYRAGISRLVNYAQQRSDLFPITKPLTAHLLTENERETVRNLWSGLLDYYIQLDSIGSFHAEYYKLSNSNDRARSFHIARSAFIAQYRFALDFIQRVENDPKLLILLNDSMPMQGLPSNSYNKFKFRFLNVIAATQFEAYNIVAATLPILSNPALALATADDKARIWQAGKGKGELLTFANAGNVLNNLSFQLLFPVQAGISEWMGDTKILRQDKSLISPAQIDTLRSRLEPGDVMLEQREWYVSNVGLPGFWSHAALYIGTAEERRAYFNSPEVHRWVIEQGESSGEFEALLRRDSAAIYNLSLKPQESAHLPRILEAISEGVSFTTIEHSAAADAVAVLRPRIARTEKAQALRRAFRYSGRPYDFNFDFQTDSSLVCTELVYKAYEPATNFHGVRLNLEEIVGRTAIPANSIAHQFDTEFGTTAQQFDMVAFLDGQEWRGIALEESVNTFRPSWQRPKWRLLTPQI